jgi:hypothetical protein
MKLNARRSGHRPQPDAALPRSIWPGGADVAIERLQGRFTLTLTVPRRSSEGPFTMDNSPAVESYACLPT